MPEELKGIEAAIESILIPLKSCLCASCRRLASNGIVNLVEFECALRVGMALRTATVAMEVGVKDWQDQDGCHEIGCGCVTEYIRKRFDTLDLASVAALDAHDSNVRYEHDLETMKMLSGIGVICVRSHEDTEPFAEALRKALDAHDRQLIEGPRLPEYWARPADCGVSGHFWFQMNGGNCLMCQEASRRDAEVERKARLDEAEWWQRYHGKDLNGEGVRRIAELSRPAAESEAGK